MLRNSDDIVGHLHHLKYVLDTEQRRKKKLEDAYHQCQTDGKYTRALEIEYQEKIYPIQDKIADINTVLEACLAKYPLEYYEVFIK